MGCQRGASQRQRQCKTSVDGCSSVSAGQCWYGVVFGRTWSVLLLQDAATNRPLRLTCPHAWQWHSRILFFCCLPLIVTVVLWRTWWQCTVHHVAGFDAGDASVAFLWSSSALVPLVDGGIVPAPLWIIPQVGPLAGSVLRLFECQQDAVRNW